MKNKAIINRTVYSGHTTHVRVRPTLLEYGESLRALKPERRGCLFPDEQAVVGMKVFANYSEVQYCQIKLLNNSDILFKPGNIDIFSSGGLQIRMSARGSLCQMQLYAMELLSDDR